MENTRNGDVGGLTWLESSATGPRLPENEPHSPPEAPSPEPSPLPPESPPEAPIPDMPPEVPVPPHEESEALALAVLQAMREAALRRCSLTAALVTTWLALFLFGCTDVSPRPDPPQKASQETPAKSPQTIVYVGSSTIANFLREAEPAYGKVRFAMDTEPESLGGEEAIQDGLTDLAGVAAEPEPRTLAGGVQATLLATDTLAVLVHPANPITNLTLDQLKQLFTGGVRNWKELGGRDLDVVPLVVSERSATRKVFRSLVLGSEDFVNARVVRPDADMPRTIEAEPGAIGAVSSSFLCSGGFVRVLSIDGEAPLTSNLEYPIVRPLYLLWNADNPEVAAFVAWAGTNSADEVLTKCFGSRRRLHR